MQNNLVVPGDVVLSEYYKLDGSKGIGLFLVVYCEKNDTSISRGNSTNITGLKITSQADSVDNYSVVLPQDKITFLDKTSFVMCNKPSSLSSSGIKTLGRVYGPYLKQIFRTFKGYLTELERQMLCCI